MSTGAQRRAGARGGYTLIEVMISLVLLTAVLGVTTLTTSQSYDAFRAARTNATVEAKLRRGVARVATELVSTGIDVLEPDPADEYGTSELLFREVVGIVGGAPVWGPQARIAFEYESGELDDGLDNNGNGLVDEGVIVLTRNVGEANETRSIVCHGVRELQEGEFPDGDDDNDNGLIDEGGLSISRVDRVLNIRVSLETLDGGGRPIVRTVTTAVRLRN